MSYDPKWHTDFLNFTKTGTASEAFLRELEHNVELQKACDVTFKQQVDAFRAELRPPPPSISGQAIADELFVDIAHGDEKHREWLKAKLDAWAPRFADAHELTQARHARNLAVETAIDSEERAERAEAACAQMRAVLDATRRGLTDVDILNDIESSLVATDVGVGWVSPEQHAEVVRAQAELKRQTKLWMDKTTAELKAVREAAERVLDCAKRHPDRLECCYAMDALLRDALDNTTRCSCGLVLQTAAELAAHLEQVPEHRKATREP